MRAIVELKETKKREMFGYEAREDKLVRSQL